MITDGMKNERKSQEAIYEKWIAEASDIGTCWREEMME